MENEKYEVTENPTVSIPIEKHPEMLIGTPKRDKRFDVITESEYTQNTESYD